MQQRASHRPGAVILVFIVLKRQTLNVIVGVLACALDISSSLTRICHLLNSIVDSHLLLQFVWSFRTEMSSRQGPCARKTLEVLEYKPVYRINKKYTG